MKVIKLFALPKFIQCRYTLLLSCWEKRPESRPTFSDIVSTLENYMESTVNYLDLSKLYNDNYDADKPDADKPDADKPDENKNISKTPNLSVARVLSDPNHYYQADS